MPVMGIVSMETLQGWRGIAVVQTVSEALWHGI